MSKLNSFLYIFTTILISFYNYSKVEGKNFEKGEAIFRSNCIICHLGGNNIIIPEKNLKKETLEANGMYSLKAITYQVVNGKNGMPAFGSRLKEVEIEEIADYVLFEAQNNFQE
jgi:cytochrome c6